MSILMPTKNRGGENRFVGVFLPPKLHQYLSLYVLSKSRDKSKIIRERMEDWMRERIQEDSEKSLILEIVAKIKDEWLMRRSGYTVVTYVNFRKEIEYELVDKGLHQDYIIAILEELDRYEASRKTRTT